jgi:hypothetical protein
MELVFTAFMSPGSVTERLFFFIGAYTADDRTGAGGGLLDDGEDIGVLELPFSEALSMIRNGQIVDGKTIMLLQHLQLSGRMGDSKPVMTNSSRVLDLDCVTKEAG